MAKRVSREVVEKVVKLESPRPAGKSSSRAPGRYLVRRDEVYFFQVRIPKTLVGCARIPPLRIKLGHRPRREAQAMAESLARAAKDVFETLAMMTRNDVFRAEGPLGFDPGASPEEFHANLLSFLERATAVVSQRPKFTARDLRNGAVWHDLFAVQQELDKGDAGSQLIQTYAATIRKEIMERWRISQGYSDEAEPDVSARPSDAKIAISVPEPARTAVAPPQPSVAPRPLDVAVPTNDAPAPPPVPPPTPAASVPTPSAGGLMFSDAAMQYLDWRRGAGADSATLSTARMRLDVYLALMGDKPIESFVPRDLQLYVNELQYLPLEYGRHGRCHAEIRSLGAKAAAERNKAERCWETMSRKTVEDGFVQVVKAVINDAVRNSGIKHPLAGGRIEWPKNLKASVAREALDDETINRIFQLGVQSGYLDDALLPPLALTTSRRIGLLAFLRGSDFERKHGVIICRVDGIGYDQAKKTWYRVPYKTSESLSYFVVHDLWSKIGFVEWAITQGEAFLFRQLHQTKDPADSLSKRVNRLMTRAGATGKNIEVAHSFRHGAKNLMRQEVDGETVRKQMGHAASSDDAHAAYGARTELQASECRRLAHMPLPDAVDWTVFEGLDFEAMASKPRERGRRGQTR